MGGSVYQSSRPEHDIQQELGLVHELIMTMHNLEQSAQVDNGKAKTLESYFRRFKMATRQADSSPDSMIKDLEQSAINEIVAITNTKLGFKGSSGALFRRAHKSFMGSKSRGGDDIFEAEFTALLNTVLDAAVREEVSLNSGVNGAMIIGNLPANISKKVMSKLSSSPNQIKQMVVKNKTYILDEPVARAAKVDVQGYSANIDISSQIRPEWQEFISLVQSTNFTLKNYSSAAATEVIHLGNSNLFKASLGTLTDVLPEDEGLHVFFHAIHHGENPEVVNHIQHWRLIYELSGGGLYVTGNNGEEIRLNTADFIVYNDPASDNIFVRSTKEIILDALRPSVDSVLSTGSSITSPVILVKSYFN